MTVNLKIGGGGGGRKTIKNREDLTFSDYI